MGVGERAPEAIGRRGPLDHAVEQQAEVAPVLLAQQHGEHVRHVHAPPRERREPCASPAPDGGLQRLGRGRTRAGEDDRVGPGAQSLRASPGDPAQPGAPPALPARAGASTARGRGRCRRPARSSGRLQRRPDGDGQRGRAPPPSRAGRVRSTVSRPAIRRAVQPGRDLRRGTTESAEPATQPRTRSTSPGAQRSVPGSAPRSSRRRQHRGLQRRGVLRPAEHRRRPGARGLEDPVEERGARTEHPRGGLAPRGYPRPLRRLRGGVRAPPRGVRPSRCLGLGARGGADRLRLAPGRREQTGDLLVVRAPERLEQVRQRHGSTPRRGA